MTMPLGATPDVALVTTDATDRANLLQGIDQPFVAICVQGGTLDANACRRLAAEMVADDAVIGFGRLQDARGGLAPPLSRVEDLRYRWPVSAHAAVFRRAWLCEHSKMANDGMTEQYGLWRLAQTAAFEGLARRSDHVVARLGDGSAADDDRVPLAVICGQDRARSRAVPRIVVYGAVDASGSLYFDALRSIAPDRVTFLAPSVPSQDLPFLIGADLVVISRNFEHLVLNGTLDAFDVMQIPYVWFTDDDFISLRSDHASFRFYTPERVGAFARRCAAILASTPALAATMRAFGPPVLDWPCVFDETLAQAAPRPRLTAARRCIGVPGGAFRRFGFETDVLPALIEISREQPIEVVARSDLLGSAGQPWIRSVAMENAFRQFVFKWQQRRCDVIVHPRGKAVNLPFKSAATLLAARYVGALPVVADEPAFDGLGEDEGVRVVQSGFDRWRSEIVRALDEDWHREGFARLDAWCRQAFSADAGWTRFTELSKFGREATAGEQERRLRRLTTSAIGPRVLQDSLLRERLNAIGRRTFAARMKRSCVKFINRISPR